MLLREPWWLRFWNTKPRRREAPPGFAGSKTCDKETDPALMQTIDSLAKVRAPGRGDSQADLFSEPVLSGAPRGDGADVGTVLDRLETSRTVDGAFSGEGEGVKHPVKPSESWERLRKRRRSKYATLPLVEELCGMDSPVDYTPALTCCDVVKQKADGELHSWYCKKRWCLVCQRHRAGRLIRSYWPVVEGWNGGWHLTLTVPNIPIENDLSTREGREAAAERLEACYDQMMDTWRAARESMRRDGMEFEAIRAFDLTVNQERGEWHLHFHVLISYLPAARALKDKWVERVEGAVRSAQYVRPEPVREKGEICELAEYTTRGTTHYKRADGRFVEAYPAEQLDVIFQALHGKRLWQPVGFRLCDCDHWEDGDPEVLDDAVCETRAIRLVGQRCRWLWVQARGDWVLSSVWDDQLGEWRDPPDRTELVGREPPGRSSRGLFHVSPS